MKKILIIVFILMLGFGGYLLYDNYHYKGIPILETEDEVVSIDKLYIYGNHFNIQGNLVDDDNLDLVLYNGDFISYNINISNDIFNLADKINEGMVLENIPVGEYYLFLRSTHKDEKDNDVYKYYILDNKTDYNETEYYTFSNVNNKIVINSDDDYKTLTMSVTPNTDNEIYDIVVDAGHGGMDSGASKNGQYESDYTLKLAIDLKAKLEAYGIKVKLTRNEGDLTKNETLPNYGANGRVTVPYKAKAKYLFSIHLNSNEYSSVGGLEVYTPYNVNYDFAKELAKNIVESAGINYSKNTINQVFPGIYTRTFTEYDINKSNKDYLSKNMIPYDITTNTNYYFIIRETGGIITGAYVDNRNEEVDENPYYKSNVGTESYLLELGYLTNKNDLNNISNNMSKYTEAIANTFKNIFEENINKENQE